MSDMDNMVSLYSPSELEGLRKKYGRGIWAASLIAAAALFCCVFLCCITNTVNAGTNERWAVGIFTAAGWVDIYLLSYTVAAVKHELTHAEMLLTDERTALEGRLEVSDQRVRIRGSISFCPLTLQDGEETHRSKVIVSRADRLRAENGSRVRVYVVNGYAAAFERL